MNAPTIRAHPAPWWNGVEIYIGDPKTGERVKEIIMEKSEPCRAEPSMRLTMEGAQTLMDDLWASGVRPTEGSGSAGSLRATERHLQDMRTLVFKTGTQIP